MKEIQHIKIENNFIETDYKKFPNTVPEEARKDGVIYFEGYVSDGEKNRNGYTIPLDAWFYDNGVAVKDFLDTGCILYNHDKDRPIGRPISFVKEGSKIKVSGYVYDNTHTQGDIARKLIRSLSTGHIALEREFEDEEGNRYTEEEFWKLGFEKIFSTNWEIFHVKAEICEFSFVTVRSNRSAVVLSNGMETSIETTAIEDFANSVAERFGKKPEEVVSLLSNHFFMWKKNNDAEETASPEAGTEAPTTETPEGEQAPGSGSEGDQPTSEAGEQKPEGDEPADTPPSEEAPAEEEQEGAGKEEDGLENRVKALETNLASLEKNLIAKYEAKFEEYKSSLDSLYKEQLNIAVSSIREEQRGKLAEVVNGENGVSGEAPKTMEEFAKTHKKK